MPTGAQLRGADTLVRTLDDAAGRLEQLTDAEHAAGQLIAETGSRSAPRDTGRMAAAHGYTVVEATVTVAVATPYAVIVHARRPWLTDTVAAQTDRIADLYLEDVDDALDHVKGT